MCQWRCMHCCHCHILISPLQLQRCPRQQKCSSRKKRKHAAIEMPPASTGKLSPHEGSGKSPPEGTSKGLSSAVKFQQERTPGMSCLMSWEKTTGAAVLVRVGGGNKKETDQSEPALAVKATRTTLNDCKTGDLSTARHELPAKLTTLALLVGTFKKTICQLRSCKGIFLNESWRAFFVSFHWLGSLPCCWTASFFEAI
jgi:hypothetical protein